MRQPNMSSQRSLFRAATLAFAGALASVTTFFGPPGVVSVATAQQPGMPDLRSMSGRPLPVPDLPPGTVVVRLARQIPANAVVGVDVVASTKGANGDSRMRTVKTGPDGRASFEGVAPGSEFQAAATIDGERVETTRFPVPGQGGTRVMLIAGLGTGGGGGGPSAQGSAAAGDPHGGGAGGAGTFRMGAPTGQVEPAADLPAGTLELQLKDGADRPLVGRLVRLGEVKLSAEEGAGRQVQAHDATTDDQGKVTYKNLATGDSAGYAAVSDHEGARISTVPFRMPPDSGMRGTILALKKTSNPAVLSLDPRTKIVIDLREEALAVMIAFFFRNTSREVFDAGEEGLMIQLPAGAVGAQEIEGGEPLEIIPGKGVRLKTPIAPDSGASFVTSVRFGYILPAEGSSSLEVRQVLPAALADPYLLVPDKTELTLSAPGIKALPTEVDGRGEKVRAYTMPGIAVGGTLAVLVDGIPARDRTGRTIAAVLCLALIAAGITLSRGRRKRGSAATGPTVQDLIDRREHIFAELVEVERQRQSDGPSPRLDDKRREIITRLESVYKELSQKV